MSDTSWYSSRWVPVLAAMMLQICGGSIYITGLYTTDLKNRFFTGGGGQSLVESLVFACNMGNWLPFAGFFNDSRFGGLRSTAVVAVLLTLFGYLGVWAWSAELIKLQYWQVWICWFVWGHGSGWFDNVAMVAAAKNFPNQRGRSVALMKSFYGLSGSVLTQVYDAFFFGLTDQYLLFLAVALPMLGALSIPFLFIVPSSIHNEGDKPVKRFNCGLSMVMCLALFLLATGLMRGLLHLGQSLSYISMIVTVLFISSLVLLVRGSRAASLEGLVPSATHHAAGTAIVPDMTVGAALCTARYWLVFIIVFVGMGSGLVVLNHIGQMVSAAGGTATETTILVSMLSVANCFGRIMFGLVPDAVGDRLSREGFLVINVLLMIFAQLLLAIGALQTLKYGCVLTGFSYGGFWTLMPSLCLDYFGSKNFATIYNIQSLAVSSSSLVFSTVLASNIYDAEAKVHPAPSGSGCAGPLCYRLTSLIMASSAFVGLLSALRLFFAQFFRQRGSQRIQMCES